MVGEARPRIRIELRAAVRVAGGHPWIFANEIVGSLQGFAPGAIVDVADPRGRLIGMGYANPHTLIAVRLLGRAEEVPDWAFLTARLQDALAYRDRVLPNPRFGRLVFAESDRLPGLVVDRYGDVLAVQSLTAGIAALESVLHDVLTQLTGATAIVAANDSPYRQMEGLSSERRVVVGELPDRLLVEEDGLLFETDLLAGQKTGYYFDQRSNRRLFASLVSGGEVLDLFCYTGSWSVIAARTGANVIGRDASEPAVALAGCNAERNGVGGRCRFEVADLLASSEVPESERERFDAVVLDPPPLARSRRSRASAFRALVRLARDATLRVKANGILVACSCSHHLSMDDLTAAVAAGGAKAGRRLRLIARGGQAPDHPVLPAAPETEYLHAVFVEVR